MIEFFHSGGLPKTTHHAKKIVKMGGFSRMADKPELTAARETWIAILRPHKPVQPFDGPLTCTIELTWTWLAGDSNKVRALGRIPHTSKPDLDNMEKTIIDAMVTCGYLTMDSRIVENISRKFRGDKPGVYIKLEEYKCFGWTTYSKCDIVQHGITPSMTDMNS